MRLMGLVKGLYPTSLKHPDNGIFPLPVRDEEGEDERAFWSVLSNLIVISKFISKLPGVVTRNEMSRAKFP